MLIGYIAIVAPEIFLTPLRELFQLDDRSVVQLVGAVLCFVAIVRAGVRSYERCRNLTELAERLTKVSKSHECGEPGGRLRSAPGPSPAAKDRLRWGIL